MSARHSGQVARSGGIDVRRSADTTLPAMMNLSSDSTGMGCDRHARMSAAGGGALIKSSQKLASLDSGPKASMVTPDASLRTRPVRPRSTAKR